MAILLFPGLPGGVELLVILLMMSMFLVVPLALVIGAYLFGKRRGRREAATERDKESTEQ